MERSQHVSSHIIFAGLCLLSLIPVLAFKYIPAVDLPNHILAASLHAGAIESSEGNFLSAHWLPSPYILFHLLMFPFIRLFGSMVAIKIVLSMYVILLPYSVFWFANEFNPGHQFLAFFSFPFIYTYHFDYGFTPYYIGIPFVFIGLCLVSKGIKKGFPWLILISASLLTLVIYLSHVISFTVYAIGVMLLLWSQRASIRSSFKGKPSTYLPLVGRGILVLAPAMFCLGAYFVFVLGTSDDALSSLKSVAYAPLFHQLVGSVRVFFTLDGWVDWLEMAIIACLILWLLVSRAARLKLNKNFLLYFGVLMLFLSVLVPREAFLGGWDLSSRFVVFGALALLTSFKIKGIRAERLVVLVVSLLMAVTISVRSYRGYFLNGLTQEFVQTVSSIIPPGSKIHTIYNAFPDSRIPLMQHAISYYHLEHGGYNPFLFLGRQYVAGIESSISLPRLNAQWNPKDTLKISEVLRHYDYLVVMTYGSELPQPLMKLSDGIVHRDSICTVVDLSRVNLETNCAKMIADYVLKVFCRQCRNAFLLTTPDPLVIEARGNRLWFGNQAFTFLRSVIPPAAGPLTAPMEPSRKDS